MKYGLFDFLQLIGSLGIFIYGMKIMSEGIQKVAGNRLRAILAGMTRNRFFGIITGFLTTVLVQSSSATTVMVVSFVNAGLLTLTESFGVIMGANIGTTLTIWMVTLLGFKVKIMPIAVMLIGLSFPFLFSGKNQLKNLAEFLVGFGILFIGLEFLKESVPNIKENPEMLEFLTRFMDMGFLTTLLFVLVGTLLTILVQSSSASTTITLIMLSQGWITFPVAAAMVLGENIGTTITANIAAMVGNIHAKRAARFHFLFNVIGVFWMLMIMNQFLILVDFLTGVVILDHNSVLEGEPENPLIALSIFHSTFNLLNVILLYAAVPYLEKIIVRLTISRGGLDEEYRLQYISGGLMSTPELSIEEARKELQLFAKLLDKMTFSVKALLFEKQKEPLKIVQKIFKRESITDNLELEIVQYLTKVSEADLSTEATIKIRGMMRIANDMERIADLLYQMAKNYERSLDLGLRLPDDAILELNALMELIYEAVRDLRKNIGVSNGRINMDLVYALEERINNKRDEIRLTHYERLNKGIYNAQAGVVFLDYVNRAEKIGDHVVNVNEALSGLV